MKIKTYFEALQISEALTKLNLDISQMDPNDRVKIKDGVILFEPEKECFASKPEPLGNSEQMEYYYLKINIDCFQEGDETQVDRCEEYPNEYYPVLSEYYGNFYKNDKYKVRRKINKND